MNEAIVGARYMHRKGGEYVVEAIALESTNGRPRERVVVYRGSKGLNVRTEREFLEDMDGKPRFALVAVQKPEERSDPRPGDWMSTFSGLRFYPCDPRPEEVCVEDIAHALACENRFGGHLPEPYSVAQHCVLASLIVEEQGGSREEQLWALLHDAAEAYVKDIPRPLKRALGAVYGDIEAGVTRSIAGKFELYGPMPTIVYRADELCLSLERRDLFLASHKHEWVLGGEDKELPAFSVHYLGWKEAEHNFLRRFVLLQEARR